MAGFGMSAGLRAGTVAYIAGFPTGDPDLGIEAVGRLFQADVQRIFKIGAAIDLRTAAATATAAANYFSDDIAEGIGEARAAHYAASTCIGVDTGWTEPIVRSALLLVSQPLVGILGLFGTFFYFLVILFASGESLTCP